MTDFYPSDTEHNELFDDYDSAPVCLPTVRWAVCLIACSSKRTSLIYSLGKSPRSVCLFVSGESPTTSTATSNPTSSPDDETNVVSPKLVKTYRRLPSYFIKMTPHFDNTTDTDVTATVGRDVFLPCSVRHLGDRTVSRHRITDTLSREVMRPNAKLTAAAVADSSYDPT